MTVSRETSAAFGRVAGAARRLGIGSQVPRFKEPASRVLKQSGQGSPFEQGLEAGKEEMYPIAFREGYAAGMAEAEGRMCGGCR